LSILDRYARKIFYCIGLIYQILKHLISMLSFPIVRNSYIIIFKNNKITESKMILKINFIIKQDQDISFFYFFSLHSQFMM
jgi:hypothetical protein